MNGKRIHKWTWMALAPVVMWIVLTAATIWIEGEYEVSSESEMVIQGTSSIHDWHCEVPDVQGVIKMLADPSSNTGFSIDQTDLNIPVSKIECGKNIMNSKLRKALKENKNPLIKFTLEKTVLQFSQGHDGNQFKAEGTLEIAGKANPVSIPVTLIQLRNTTFQFKGEANISMRAYGVKPPTAMLGALKTGNDIVVSFSIKAVAQNSTEN